MQNLDRRKIVLAGGIVAGVLLLIILVLYLRGGGGAQTTQLPGTFGTAPSITLGGSSGAGSATGGTVGPAASSSASFASIFKIAGGPVVSATLVTAGSSTTVARYITGTDGHVLDLTLDTPGGTARIVSNTTIPGIERALWTEGGKGVIVQYLEGGTVKSAHLALPSSGSTGATSTGMAIRFFPDAISAIAASPDGAKVAYLLPTSSGVDGYVSGPDSSSAKKLFSLPLSQLILSWPAPSILVVHQKSAVNTPGVAFTVNVSTGNVRPLLSGLGLTVLANHDLSYLLYQTNNGSGGTTYVQKAASGEAVPVSFSPLSPAFPERCVWGSGTSTLAYCPAPQGGVDVGYLDQFHRGQASVADGLVLVRADSASTTVIALPGVSGGEYADMTELSVAPSGTYLSYIAKDSGALWGVRLTTRANN